MLNDETLKYAMRMELKSSQRFTINENGSLDITDKSYDLSAINEYIMMLQAREKDAMRRGFEQGERSGYHEGIKAATSSIYGDYFFIEHETKVVVRVYSTHIEAFNIREEIDLIMQRVDPDLFYKQVHNDKQ